jgi:hypothetical protein
MAGSVGMSQVPDVSLIGPIELLLVNLESEISPEYLFLHVGREVALARLKVITGQDFGYDVGRWRDWLTQNGFVRHKDYGFTGDKE